MIFTSGYKCVDSLNVVGHGDNTAGKEKQESDNAQRPDGI